MANASKPLDKVDITDQLDERFDDTHRHARESEALVDLARDIAGEPTRALQLLSERVLVLTGADAAGVSVIETVNGEEVFRWRATAGDFADLLAHTMPVGSSPSGEVLRTGATLLMHDPGRRYSGIAALGRPLGDVLLAPFHRDGIAIGTVWVASRPFGRRFDREDARLLETMSVLAASANDLLEKLSFGNPGYSEA